MAQRVSDQPFISRPQRRYPWEEWMDGAQWDLVEGEDFPGKAESFRNYIHSVAKKHGRRASVRKLPPAVEGGPTTLRVCFFVPDLAAA